MLVPGIAQTVRQGRLDAETHYRYFPKPASRCRNQHPALVIVLSVSSGVAASEFVLEYGPSWLALVFALLAFISTALILTLNFGERSARADMASMHFNWLADKWSALWWHQDDPSTAAQAKQPNIRATIPMLDCPLNGKLIKESHKEAEQFARVAFQRSDDHDSPQNDSGPLPTPPSGHAPQPPPQPPPRR